MKKYVVVSYCKEQHMKRHLLTTFSFLVLLSGLWLLAWAYSRGLDLDLTSAELLSVVDGDTVRLNIGPGLQSQSCRLRTVDTPELFTTAGWEARIALESFLQDKKLNVQIRGVDRYGRLLVDLKADEQDVAEWLIAHGYGRRWKERRTRYNIGKVWN